MTIILPAWLLLLIFFGWACTLIVVWQQLDIRRQPWSSWRRGTIFGIQWGWRWQGRRAIQLTPYCTADETPLVFHFRPELGDVIYVCESCGAEYGPFAGDHRYVLSMIGRQIERRVTDGSWRSDAAPQSPADVTSAVGITAFQSIPVNSESTEVELGPDTITEPELTSTAAEISEGWTNVPSGFSSGEVIGAKTDDDDLADLGPVISKR